MCESLESRFDQFLAGTFLFVNEKFQQARAELLELIRRYIDLSTSDVTRGEELIRRRLSAVKRWRDAPGHFDWDIKEFESQLEKVDDIQNEFRAWLHDNREESIETLAKRSGIETEHSRSDERMLEFINMQIEVRKRKIKYEIPALNVVVSRLSKAVVRLEKIAGT